MKSPIYHKFEWAHIIAICFLVWIGGFTVGMAIKFPYSAEVRIQQEVKQRSIKVISNYIKSEEEQARREVFRAKARQELDTVWVSLPPMR